MKKLTCEMCGSTDLLKQEGVFVCQSCGTKYSVEDAKRMMTEGTGEVINKVAVDNSAKLDNLYKLARRAKEGNDSEKACQYYEQILIDDPNSWEASFFSVYYSAILKWRNDEKGTALNLLLNCIDTVFDLIKNNVDEIGEQFSVVRSVSSEIDGICGAFYQSNKDNFEAFYSRYKEAGYSSNNWNLFLQCVARTTQNNSSLSKIRYASGKKILIMYENDGELDDIAKELIKVAISTALANPCSYIHLSYGRDDSGLPDMIQLRREEDKNREALISLYTAGLEEVENKQKVLAQKRINEYWATHQSEKTALDSEKQSLLDQISSLNKEIEEIPQKTEGYSKMLELQKKAEELVTQKKSLGIFKLKEKKAIQEQIDTTNSEIGVIKSLIDGAIEKEKQNIASLEKRIEEIDTELTKSR